MTQNNSYNPTIAIHPGETLKDTLEGFKMTSVDLSERVDLTVEVINGIIQGRFSIDENISKKLSSVFGMSFSFWVNLQKNYDEDLLRLNVR